MLSNQNIINYITQKNAWRGEFGEKQNKPMIVSIKGSYVICTYYNGIQSDYGAFLSAYMPAGGGLIRREIYNELKYYINDVIIEMLSQNYV